MLDTNAVSALAKGQAARLVALLDKQPYCISVITEAEIRFGLARRVVNAKLRRIVEQFLNTVNVRPWNSDCAQGYARLRADLEAKGTPLAPMDLLIATQALAADCILVTADRAFGRVSGLRVLDWSGVSAATGGVQAGVVRKRAAPVKKRRPPSADS